jgi:TM2 domain-containing membrane protein YozV
MKKSLKGALLSGLVFPGAGQLWLKYYFRGIALIIAVTASLGLIVVKATQQAYAILEKAEAEGATVDLTAILNSSSHTAGGAEDFLSRAASALLVICWVIGIVDAYLMGRKMDRIEQAKKLDQ